MSGALYIPGADRTTRWFFKAGYFPDQFLMPRIDKDLLHSTETQKKGGCPGYAGGGNAPQVTINPWPGYQKIYQHFPIPRAGRALGNPASTPVSENKDNVFQVEIIGFSDPALGRQYGCYLPELPDEGLQYIADMLIFVHKEWPHPTTLPSTWPLYKVSSYAAMNAAHMTSAQYDAHRGMLAHLHAPVPSTHGDVAIKIQALKAKVDKGLAPVVTPPTTPTTPTTPTKPPTTVTYRPYPGHQHADNLRDDSHVGLIQRRLKALGLYKSAIDNSFGPGTKAAVIAFQRQQKITADGFVGPTTWARLKIPA